MHTPEASTVPVPAVVTALLDRYSSRTCISSTAVWEPARLWQEYLDPFFSALGWEMQEASGLAPASGAYARHMALTLRDGTRHTGCVFFKHGSPRFLVVLVRPEDDVEHQATVFRFRRYAWSAEIPLLVLTSVDAWSVHDCTLEPEIAVNCHRTTLATFQARDLTGAWDRISTLLGAGEGMGSPQARTGTVIVPLSQGSHSVTQVLRQDLESWRKALARRIAAECHGISTASLNDAVHQAIFHALLIQLCNDRRVPVPLSLISGLPEGISPGPGSDPGAGTPCDPGIAMVHERFSGPESPYELAAIPVPALASVLEQFLGKGIRMRGGHRPEVEARPGTLMAGSQSRPPRPVVEYLTRQLVRDLAFGATTPCDLASARILDPACGGGLFLSCVYQALLDWHLDWYLDHLVPDPSRGPTSLFREPGEPWDPVHSRALGSPSQELDVTVNPVHPPGHMSPSREPGEPEGPVHSHGLKSPQETGEPVAPAESLPVGGYGPGMALPVYRDPESGFPPGRSGWRLTFREKARVLADMIYGVDIDRQAAGATVLLLMVHLIRDMDVEECRGIAGDAKGGEATRMTEDAGWPDDANGAEGGSKAEGTRRTGDAAWPEAGKEKDPDLPGMVEYALASLRDHVRCGNALIGPDYFDLGQAYPYQYRESLKVNPFSWQGAFPRVMDRGGFDAVTGAPPDSAVDLTPEQKKYLQMHYAVYQDMAGMTPFFIEKGLSLLAPGGELSFFVPSAWLRARTGKPLRKHLAGRQILEITCFDGIGGETGDFCLIRVANIPPAHPFLASRVEGPLPMALEGLARSHGHLVDQATLPDGGWTLEDTRPEQLLERLRAAGRPLGAYVMGQVTRGTSPVQAPGLQLQAEDIRRYEPPTLKGKPRKTGIPRDTVPRIQPRIIGPSQACFPSFTLETAGLPAGGDVTLIPYPDLYLLALLNSRICAFFIRMTTKKVEDGTYPFTPRSLSSVPIYVPDFEDEAEKALHNRIEQQAARLLAMQGELATVPGGAERAVLKRRIRAAEEAIDEVVYTLYHISGEERDVIEREVARDRG